MLIITGCLYRPPIHDIETYVEKLDISDHHKIKGLLLINCWFKRTEPARTSCPQPETRVRIVIIYNTGAVIHNVVIMMMYHDRLKYLTWKCHLLFTLCYFKIKIRKNTEQQTDPAINTQQTCNRTNLNSFQTISL